MTGPIDVVVQREQKITLGGIEVGSPTVRRALVLSFWDGAFSTAMVALTETFGIAAAVSLQAPSMAIALLGSTPLLLGSLGQYFLPALVDVSGARKTAVLVGVGLQSSFLLVTGFAGFIAAPYAAWAYVASFALFAFVNLSCALVAGLSAKGYTSKMPPLPSSPEKARRARLRTAAPRYANSHSESSAQRTRARRFGFARTPGKKSNFTDSRRSYELWPRSVFSLATAFSLGKV